MQVAMVGLGRMGGNMARRLMRDPTLSEYTGFVQDSGEGRWTIAAAIEEGCRRPCCQQRCTPDFAPARNTRSPRKPCLPCDKSSAVISSHRREDDGTLRVATAADRSS
jgi:6-phosphogluconate dehydrogenase (decarboxylating)